MDPMPHYNLGKLSEKHLKDFQKAKEHYERAIELNPEVTILTAHHILSFVKVVLQCKNY